MMGRYLMSSPNPGRPTRPATRKASPQPAGGSPAPADEIDVEIVVDLVQVRAGPERGGLTRRDFLMVFAGGIFGAGGVLLAVAVGWLLARIRSRHER
jgi:hypothetical protein